MNSILLNFLISVFTDLVFANSGDFALPKTNFDVQDNFSTFDASTTDFEPGPQPRAACPTQFCKFGFFDYKPCKAGKCGRSPFSECLGGTTCRDCVVYQDDCSSKPCCALAGDSFASYCSAGKCRFCNKYDQPCSYIKTTGSRTTCCKTAGKTDVQCRYLKAGQPVAVCRGDPCSSGEEKPKVSPNGFTGPVERCDAVLRGEPQNHDFECVGGACVRCLGYMASCGADSSSGLKCCSTYLKCGSGGTCELKSCRPQGFQCSTDDSCCSKECKPLGAGKACY